MFKKTLTGLALGLLLATTALQSIADDHLYLGTTLGYMLWDDERFLDNDEDGGTTLGLNLGYEFAERFAIEAGIGGALSDPHADIYRVSLYNFLKADREGVNPYWVAGLDYVAGMDDPSVSRITESVSAHFGLGLSNYINENLELRGDIRVSKAIDSDGNLDSYSLNDLADWGLNLALNYHFGDAPKPAKSTAAPAAPTPSAKTTRPETVEEPRTRSITLEIAVFFDTDKDVAIGYGPELPRVAAAMKKYPELTLTLEGHTDSRASNAYNQDLSQRRADRVKARMVDDYQISGSRITAIGYGEERPIADNDTEAGRAENRRVVGVISWEEKIK